MTDIAPNVGEATPEGSKKHEEVARRLKDTAGVQAALKRAARDAVQEHARAGKKIVVWRDNQVVWEDPNAAVTPSKSTADDCRLTTDEGR